MKKKWIITGGIVLAVLVALAGCLAGTVNYWINRGFGISEGIYLEGTGAPLLILDGSPFVMGDRSEGENLFDGLETGDKILVLHDGLCESYPGQTGVYWIKRLGAGSLADISSDVLDSLVQMGWISQMEAAADGAEACGFSAQYIRTNGYHEGVEYPVVTVIRSAAELNAYYESNKELYSMGRRESAASDSTIGFLDACDKYDDAYFEKQILVLILLEEGSGSIRHEVTDVRTGGGRMVVSIDTIVPEIGTCDMAEWHIFVEPEAGVDVTCGEAVQVYMDSRNITREPETVECHWGNTAMALAVLPGWEYEITEYTEGCSTFGISFRPQGCEGTLSLLCYPNGFGVCGTGLNEKKITVAGLEAWQGTYDGRAVWSFISFIDTPKDYVFMNDGADGWWKEYGDEAMFIIQSVSFEGE